MLPDPKKVAKAIDKLFQSPEERRQEVEMNRDVQVRLGKARLRRHLAHQQEMLKKLTSLAKRALALNDDERFRQVGRQLLWTQQDVQRWEKYLLSLEVLEARRDQVKASVDLLQSVKAMSESLSELAAPAQMADLQRDLEQGLARASSMEERMALMMEVMDATLASDMPADETALEGLESKLTEEVAADESAAFDPALDELRRKIRQEMEHERK